MPKKHTSHPKRAYPRSAKVIALGRLGGPPSAIYPSAAAAATILGVSRQAIQKALVTRERVKGFLFMRYSDYITQPKSEEERS